MTEISDIIGVDELDDKLKTDLPVIVYMRNSWSDACKIQWQEILEIADKLNGKIKILKIDVDENSRIVLKYNLSVVPAVLIFYKSELKEKKEGLVSKAQIADMLIKYM